MAEECKDDEEEEEEESDYEEDETWEPPKSSSSEDEVNQRYMWRESWMAWVNVLRTFCIAELWIPPLS